jgi:hypothetical protein
MLRCAQRAYPTLNSNILCPPHVNCTFPTLYQPPVYLPPNPLEYQIFWQNLNNTTTLQPSIQLYILNYYTLNYYKLNHGFPGIKYYVRDPF